VVDATLMDDEMQAGADTPSVKPSLPDAITVTIPAMRRLSMISLRESLLQGEV